MSGEVLLLVAAAGLLTALAWGLAQRARRRRAAELAALREAEESTGRGGPLPVVGDLLGTLLKGSVGLLAGLVLPPREIAALADEGGNLTILFCDVVGSLAINLEVGDERWAAIIGAHDRVSAEVVAAARGKVLKRQGDGFMAVLPSAVAGVTTAMGLREALRDHPEIGRALPVRIGVHTGQVVDRRDDIFGENVAFAARVAEAAEADQVLVSSATVSLLDAERRALLGTARRHRLKGLPGRHELHPVRG